MTDAGRTQRAERVGDRGFLPEPFAANVDGVYDDRRVGRRIERKARRAVGTLTEIRTNLERTERVRSLPSEEVFPRHFVELLDEIALAEGGGTLNRSAILSGLASVNLEKRQIGQ